MRLIQLNGGGGGGGADTVCINLGRELEALGHQTVIAARPDFFKNLGLSASAANHWLIPNFRGFPLRALREFNRRAASADIVLTHESNSRHFALFAKMLGLRPRVWFLRHCISGTTRFGGVQLHRLLVDHHIAVSNAIQQELLASGFPSNRVTRIYGGTHLAPFAQPDPAVVARHRAAWLEEPAPGVMVIGIVARMHIQPGDWQPGRKEGKGYDVLFAALSKVSFPFRVLIFGPHSPAVHETLRLMARHYGVNPDCLRMAGFQKDMSGCYQLMDINVLPSRREGLGLALIEGMASGVACVGSRSGGIVEIIEHEQTGLLFSEGNADELAACLERLVANPGWRAELSRRGQASVLGRFDAAAMARNFCALAAAKGIR